MPFRFRKRTRLFPGLSLNWSKNGLSSISIGAPGATVNIPVARDGQTRGTVGLPGTGLSYSHEGSRKRSVRERQQAQRPTVPTTEQLLQDLEQVLYGKQAIAYTLWTMGIAERVQNDPATPRAIREQAFLVATWERVELHIRRGRGQAETIARVRQVCQAATAVLTYADEQGWVDVGDA